MEQQTILKKSKTQSVHAWGEQVVPDEIVGSILSWTMKDEGWLFMLVKCLLVAKKIHRILMPQLSPLIQLMKRYEGFEGAIRQNFVSSSNNPFSNPGLFESRMQNDAMMDACMAETIYELGERLSFAYARKEGEDYYVIIKCRINEMYGECFKTVERTPYRKGTIDSSYFAQSQSNIQWRMEMLKCKFYDFFDQELANYCLYPQISPEQKQRNVRNLARTILYNPHADLNTHTNYSRAIMECMREKGIAERDIESLMEALWCEIAKLVLPKHQYNALQPGAEHCFPVIRNMKAHIDAYSLIKSCRPKFVGIMTAFLYHIRCFEKLGANEERK